MLFKNFYKKIRNTYFPEHFCWLLSLQGKNNRKRELKCVLDTALISNAFLNSFLSKVSALWRNEMEDSVFIKTEDVIGKFCFWL